MDETAHMSHADPRTLAIDRVSEVLSEATSCLHWLVDAARSSDLPDCLEDAGLSYECMFVGRSAETLRNVAPYVVRLGTHEQIRLAVGRGWGDNWGVFVDGPPDVLEVRDHFRRFTQVELPDGRQGFFRFYDPRVLGPFLATCTSDSLSRFFGPMKAFWWVDNRRKDLVCDRIDASVDLLRVRHASEEDAG